MLIKNIFKNKKYITFALFAFFGIIFFANAQTGGPSITFISPPTVTFTIDQDDISGTISGGISLGGGVSIGNALVAVAISEDPIDPQTYNGPYQINYVGSTDPLESDFSQSNYFFSTIDGNYNQGQTYYFLFKTSFNSDGAPPPGTVLDSEVVSAEVPVGTGGEIDPNDNPNPVPTTTQSTAFNPDIDWNSIDNPLGQEFDILLFLQKLFANLVKITLPFLVIFLIYSGFLFVEAQGNEEKLAAAKKNFLYVVIGGIVILGAWTIAMALKGTVEQLEEPISLLEVIINLV